MAVTGQRPLQRTSLRVESVDPYAIGAEIAREGPSISCGVEADLVWVTRFLPVGQLTIEPCHDVKLRFHGRAKGAIGAVDWQNSQLSIT